MTDAIKRVLLVAAPWGDNGFIQAAIEESYGESFHIHSLSDYGDALVYLNMNQDLVDVCLLEYSIGANDVFSFFNDLEAYLIRPLPLVVLRGDEQRKHDTELIRLGVDVFWDAHRDGIETLVYSINNAIYHHQHFLQLHNKGEYSSNFVAQIVHELKNPLNAIMGFSRVAERLCNEGAADSDPQRMADCFQAISRNSDHLKVLIEELLHITQLDSAGFAIEQQQVDLSGLLEASLDNYLPMAEQHAIALSAEIEPGLQVLGDAKWLQQVFGNLLSNAIKYTEQGEVRVVANRDEQGCIRVAVHDTGIGIDAKDFDAVFSEYTKVHRTLNKQVDSTGLGLPIAKRLVEMHGGTIALASTLGEGATFTVQLPAAGSAARNQ